MATTYEEQMVPILFGPWAEDLVDRLDVRPGERALDVACGTGAATRVLAERVGPDGQVVGIDLNPLMLGVAASLALTNVELREGDAASLPFDDAEFDLALCQQGLQFVPEPEAAIAEMARVLRPGGRVGLACWNGPHENIIAAAIGAAAEAIGWTSGAEGYARAFSMGDAERMEGLLVGAGLEPVDVSSREATSVWPDVPGWLSDFSKGPPFIEDYEAADDATRTRFVTEALDRLERCSVGATHEIPWVATVAVASKSG